MNEIIESLEIYVRSEAALLHIICGVVSFLNQFVVVRNFVRVVRTSKLGLWPIWGPIVGATLAVDDFLFNSGYGALVAVMTIVMFSFDAIFLKLGLNSKPEKA